MSGMKVIGYQTVMKSIGNKASRLQDRSKANAQAVAVIDGWIQKNFKAEGDMAMGGSGWKQLAPSTIKAREKGWGNYKRHKTKNPLILQDTGALKGRWKHGWNRRRGYIRSGVVYGIAHQKGAGHLPERRILPQEPQIMPQMALVYKRFIKGILND